MDKYMHRKINNPDNFDGATVLRMLRTDSKEFIEMSEDSYFSTYDSLGRSIAPTKIGNFSEEDFKDPIFKDLQRNGVVKIISEPDLMFLLKIYKNKYEFECVEPEIIDIFLKQQKKHSPNIEIDKDFFQVVCEARTIADAEQLIIQMSKTKLNSLDMRKKRIINGGTHIKLVASYEDETVKSKKKAEYLKLFQKEIEELNKIGLDDWNDKYVYDIDNNFTIYFAETGMDREMDFDAERWFEDFVDIFDREETQDKKSNKKLTIS